MYLFSKRDKQNRATLILNGIKVGRVHFRKQDSWLNPYKNLTLKSQKELEDIGLRVEYDNTSQSYPIKVFVDSCVEEDIADALSKVFY